jgi:hypothetical protein
VLLAEARNAGRRVYTWSQELEEVHVYVEPPPGVTSKLVDCEIGVKHLRLGIKGNPPFLNVSPLPESAHSSDVCLQEDFAGMVVADESFWTLGETVLRCVQASDDGARAQRMVC